MTDIFDNVVLCNKCSKKMNRIEIHKEGFVLRALECPECGEKITHPSDIQEYKHFSQLKNKTFAVKLRMVGNSYTVSIPKEIIEYVQEQERIMSHMVKLCFEEIDKISLEFSRETKNIKNKPHKL